MADYFPEIINLQLINIELEEAVSIKHQ